MTMKAKILDKANRIRERIKILSTEFSLVSPQRRGDGSKMHKSINVIYHINKLKDKHPIVISFHKQRSFDKLQHIFMVKVHWSRSQEFLKPLCSARATAHSHSHLPPSLHPGEEEVVRGQQGRA